MEAEKEIISVIVPIYNIQEYVGQCIESICGQSCKNLEIILVDDGSVDESSDICNRYAEKDSRIKVLHKQNEGLVRARKDGLSAATGKYIAYVDGDDWIEPDMMQSLYTILTEQNVDIVMCGWYEDTGNIQKEAFHGIQEGWYGRKELKEKVFPHMIANGAFFEWGIFPGMWGKLYRRKALEEFQKEVDDRVVMGEDAACTYPCILNAGSIYMWHKCLYHYRQTTSSMIKQTGDKMSERQRFRILYKSVKEQFRRYQYIYDLREQWKEYILFLMIPRAGYLYEGMEELDFLFPFPGIKKGSCIIIYGMGTYGQLLYRFLEKTGFCKIVAAVDRNYAELRKQGISVSSPDVIGQYEYDAIVVANSFAGSRNAVYQDLIVKYPKEKVHMMDEDLISSSKTLTVFGLE